MEPALPDIAGELYALPPGEFTAARDARAKELRDTDRDLAAAVKALPKTTAAAWAVNVLARDHDAELGPLLDVGAQMQQAQAELDGTTLRELQTRVQQVLRGLLRTAKRDAAEAGVALGAGPGEQVMATLRAAMADPAAAAAVRSGRLVRALEHTGFGDVDVSGAVGGDEPAAGRRATRPPAGDPPARTLRAVPAAGRTARTATSDPSENHSAADRAARERAERERAEQERLDRERAERERLRAEAQAAYEEATENTAEAQERLHDSEAELEDLTGQQEGLTASLADLESRLEAARKELAGVERRQHAATRERDRAARAAERAEAAERRAQQALDDLRPLRVVED